MGTYKDDTYYDSVYENSQEYKNDSVPIRYRKLWHEVSKKLEEGDFILDIGCGTGQFGLYISKAPVEYVGIDFSKEAINQAKKRSPYLNFVHGDARTVSLDYPYDVVVCMETLEHLENEVDILKRLHGRIVFTVPSFDDPAHVRYFPDIESVIERYSKWILIHSIKKVGHWYLCTGIIDIQACRNKNETR